jgi:hypothetical protein
LILSLVGSISACSEKSGNEIGDNAEQTQTPENPQLPAQKRQQKNDDAVNKEESKALAKRLLEDGFYQQQVSDTTVSDTHVNDETTLERASDSEQDSAELGALSQDNKSLIEDLGFSAAEQTQSTETEAIKAEPFCLVKQKTEANSELIKDACRQISKRLASVKYSACEAAQLQLTGYSSVNGFPILMREFAPVQERKPQGRILIVGGTHGDELTSVSVTLRWIEKLSLHHRGLFHWHLVPMMNPDGVLKKGATRTNGNGVDLNRNMPSDDWERNAIKYWEEKGGKDPRKYPGETASSEPETQWLIDEINSFKPDAIISVHAPYGVVDFDSLLLNTAPKSLGKLRLNLLGTYPGSLGNYAGINLNIPVITLELAHSWEMPSEAESTKIWQDIVSWLKKNVNSDLAKSN